jgi:hypothetical protein
MTKTPKTDTEARLTTIDCDDSCVEIYIKRDGKNVEGDIVIADFARQLEEKNAELKTILEQCRLFVSITPHDSAFLDRICQALSK